MADTPPASGLSDSPPNTQEIRVAAEISQKMAQQKDNGAINLSMKVGAHDTADIEQAVEGNDNTTSSSDGAKDEIVAIAESSTKNSASGIKIEPFPTEVNNVGQSPAEHSEGLATNREPSVVNLTQTLTYDQSPEDPDTMKKVLLLIRPSHSGPDSLEFGNLSIQPSQNLSNQGTICSFGLLQTQPMAGVSNPVKKQDSSEKHSQIDQPKRPRNWLPDSTDINPIVYAPNWYHAGEKAHMMVIPTSDSPDACSNASERWITGYHHNVLQINALFPDEIWENIIQGCDNHTIWSLRNSCRKMMALCEETPVARGRRASWYVRDPIPTKSSRGPWWGVWRYIAEVKAALNETQFCKPCQQARAVDADPLNPNMVMDKRDVGTMGVLPICEHLSVTNHQIQEWLPLTPGSRRSVTCTHKSHDKYCGQTSRPTFQTRGLSGTVVHIEWEAAIVTLTYGDNGKPIKRLSYTALRDLIWDEASKADGGLPRLLCPHLSWDDHSLLRPFDPTVCCCLDTGDLKIPEFHDPDYCQRQERQHSCCLCDAAEHNEAAKQSKAEDSMYGGIFGENYVPHQGCCTECYTYYTWTRDLDKETKKWKLLLKMWCVIGDPEPTGKVWLSHVDPSTVPDNWARHATLKHHTWCDDQNCSTSYRGRMRTRLMKI